MNRQEHLMTIGMEECNEVAQRLAKALRFGLEQIQQAPGDFPEQNPERLTNRERIMAEFLDLIAVMEMAGFEYNPSEHVVPILAKQAKVEHYLKFSAAHGTLQEG